MIQSVERYNTMAISFSANNYGYTDNGNLYKKSKAGKKIGTVAGLAMLYPVGNLGFKVAYNNGLMPCKNISEFAKKLVKFVKKGPSLSETFLSTLKGGEKFGKVMNFLSKSKVARVGTAGLLVALPITSAAMFGRLFGKGVDKIVNHHSKKQADRM